MNFNFKKLVLDALKADFVSVFPITVWPNTIHDTLGYTTKKSIELKELMVFMCQFDTKQSFRFVW